MELCIYFCILNTYTLRPSFMHELALNLLKATSEQPDELMKHVQERGRILWSD